jgi:hypothetical protein
LVKFGGMNQTGNRPYRMNGYLAFVQAAFDAGFTIVGDYLVTGGHDPAGAARFWLAHRDSRIQFHVLDNEVLDDGNVYTDGEACAYFDTIGGQIDRWQYGSRDSLWNAHSWPGLAARGIKAHVAIYNNNPFVACYPRTYPAALVQAHQYTSSATIGGLSNIDANAWTDDAFTAPATIGEDIMAVIVERQANGTTFTLEQDRIIYHPAGQDQNVARYVLGNPPAYGLSETDFIIALYRFCGFSQTLVPWPDAEHSATSILDSVLPGPAAQYTRQTFDAAGTPTIQKFN